MSGRRLPVWAGVLVGAVAALVLRPGWAEAMLLLASLVIVPLGLGLVAPGGPQDRSDPACRAAVGFQFPAALLLAASFAVPAGPWAAFLALPWLGVTALVALHGLTLLRQGPRTVFAAATSAGMIYLAVGGVWAVAARAGLRPLGFPDVIVLMTAVHFHYAGFALPLLAGRVAREVGGTFAGLAGLGVVVGVPLVALGITDTQVSPGVLPPHSLELVAAWVLAGATALVGLSQLRLALRPGRPGLPRLLLAVSGLAVLGTMTLAGAYAFGGFTTLVRIPILPMVRYHGVVNALGFAWPGLLAWTLIERSARRRVTSPAAGEISP